MTRKIRQLIIHHSASGKDTTVEQIRSYHMKERHYSDIGYHYIITYDGKIHVGRPEDTVGAHVQGHNASSIGICLVGNSELSPMSKEQEASLVPLMEHLLDKHSLRKKDVLGHSEIADNPTLCPGRLNLLWLQKWRGNIPLI
jgi:N-acetylmuramoyl-L-alanine amidase